MVDRIEEQQARENSSGKVVSRREFLKLTVLAAAGTALAACTPERVSFTPSSTSKLKSPGEDITPLSTNTSESTEIPTPEPTPTLKMGKIPENADDFIFGAGGSQEQIIEEITKNGGKETLDAEINFYKEVLNNQEADITARILSGEKDLQHIRVQDFKFVAAFSTWKDESGAPHFSWTVVPYQIGKDQNGAEVPDSGTFWFIQQKTDKKDEKGNPLYLTLSRGDAFDVYNNSPADYQLIPGVSPDGVGKLKEQLTPSKEGWFWVGYYDKNGDCLFLKDIANDQNKMTGNFKPKDSAVSEIKSDPNTKGWQALDISGQILYFYDAQKQEWVSKEAISQSIKIESLTPESENDLFEGKIKLNEEVAKKFYEDFWKALLDGKLNDDFFRKNFGIQNPSSASYDQFMKNLRAKNYVVPEGLIVPGNAGSIDRAVRHKMPEFIGDTFILDVWTNKQWNENQQLLSTDPKQVKQGEWVSPGTPAGHIFGIRTVESADGKNRLNLILASQDYPGYNFVFIRIKDIQQADALKILDKDIEFLPHLALNLQFVYENPFASGPDKKDLYLPAYFSAKILEDLQKKTSNFHPIGIYDAYDLVNLKYDLFELNQ